MFSSCPIQPMDVVIPPINDKGGLYLGGVTAAKDVKTLLERKITAVVTVLIGFDFVYPKEIKTQLFFPVRDVATYNISQHFDECTQFLEEHLAHTNVLIHCFAGASRSATIVLAFLMTKNQWSFKYSYRFLKSVRSIIEPNEGFVEQLKTYSHKLKNTSK